MEDTSPIPPMPAWKLELIQKAIVRGAEVKSLSAGVAGYTPELLGRPVPGGPFRTEDEAWDLLLFRTALSKPGKLLLVTPEFGQRFGYHAAIRSRLEVRQVGAACQIALIERRYPHDGEACDEEQSWVAQSGGPMTFRDVGGAAAAAVQYLRDFQQCVDEDRAAALEAAEERGDFTM